MWFEGINDLFSKNKNVSVTTSNDARRYRVSIYLKTGISVLVDTLTFQEVQELIHGMSNRKKKFVDYSSRNESIFQRIKFAEIVMIDAREVSPA